MRQRKVRALYSQKLRPAGSRSVKMQLRPSGRQTENLHILRSDSFRKSGSQSLDSRFLGRKAPGDEGSAGSRSFRQKFPFRLGQYPSTELRAETLKTFPDSGKR